MADNKIMEKMNVATQPAVTPAVTTPVQPAARKGVRIDASYPKADGTIVENFYDQAQHTKTMLAAVKGGRVHIGLAEFNAEGLNGFGWNPKGKGSLSCSKEEAKQLAAILLDLSN